ncbi:KAP family P-loop-containing NTPase [Geotalea daltonii FRC-32]|uniref:KAP family P-loop-containing NTPase n=1 Tax=Geotalea daltonii (strain DSM 22248 / JCM 15807 / FRC-32) TaxID=316067 RepID=B9M3Q0_GEODF|nr:P-loop NTPase fold protein [Geotalea daltonii]ACM21471.1 KAP family P-loop-containing NTPase [Geotalea daltonii FRC-32]
MNLKEMEDSIKLYIRDMHPEYSLLITGEWGSGKTYFWENVIQAGVYIDYPNGERNTTYISLYGIQSKIEIDQLITVAISDFLRLTSANNVTSALSSLSQKHIDLDNAHEIMRASNIVLCVDDLERVKMPIDTVLGYLNKLVEHEHIRMIILCDESKIENLDVYTVQKEKLVGYTFRYVPDMDAVVNKLIAGTSKKHAYANTKKVFDEYYAISKCNNIRTISKAFSIFNSVCDYISIENIDVLDSILYFTLVIMNEYKSGLLNDKSILEIATHLEASSSFYLFKQDENSVTRKIVSKYYHGNHNGIPKFGSLFNYILYGYLNTKLLDDNVSKYIEDKSIKVRTQEELFHSDFWLLSDESMTTIAKAFLEEIAGAKIKNAVTLINLAQRLFFFSKERLITQSPVDIENGFIAALNVLRAAGQLECNKILWTPLSFNDVDLDEYRSVKATIKLICDEMQNIGQKEEVTQTFSLLDNEPDEFFKRFYETQHATTPVLSDIDANWLFNIIIKSSPDTILKFQNWVDSRYSASNIIDFLEAEKSFLEIVMSYVASYLSEHTSGIKAYSVRSLRNGLASAIQKLSRN